NYREMKENDLEKELYFFKGDFTTLFGDESVEKELKKGFKENEAQRKTILKLIKKQLQEDFVKHSCIKKLYDGKYKRDIIEKASLHVKKEIYRLPSVIVNNLLHLLNSSEDCIWDVRMLDVVGDDALHHLKMILSNATELRLRCYTENNGQVDESKGQLLPSFLVKDGTDPETFSSELILRYYQTAIPLVYAIEVENSQEIVEQRIGQTSLYDPSDLNNAIAYILMKNQEKAKEHLKKANETYITSEPMQLILHILCNIYIKDEGISKPFLDNLKNRVLDSKNIDAMNTFGYALQKTGDNKEAIKVLEKSVDESPNDVTTLTLLLLAYKKEGMTAEYENLLRTHPALEEIDRLRNNLEETKKLLEVANEKVQKKASNIDDLTQQLSRSRQMLEDKKLEALDHSAEKKNLQSELLIANSNLKEEKLRSEEKALDLSSQVRTLHEKLLTANNNLTEEKQRSETE
ncbi:unnamed protein product, partial [Owenia fusiformis]